VVVVLVIKGHCRFLVAKVWGADLSDEWSNAYFEVGTRLVVVVVVVVGLMHADSSGQE